ncbi:hypothetical protein AXG93_2528s1850 [Marchantia polymorpha subsp. ruderalis]|uniref:Uncharacterized protein n=1 Tax=Marchantia polymorpha subsp. ruderalis TaxID=1480154 RepID=A0A176WNT2_MARPO|nr:hypothetical protein AXG93_2528s1850 [Marchantia polymorpha subsp. ruderalis]
MRKFQLVRQSIYLPAHWAKFAVREVYSTKEPSRSAVGEEQSFTRAPCSIPREDSYVWQVTEANWTQSALQSSRDFPFENHSSSGALAEIEIVTTTTTTCNGGGPASAVVGYGAPGVQEGMMGWINDGGGPIVLESGVLLLPEPDMAHLLRKRQ